MEVPKPNKPERRCLNQSVRYCGYSGGIFSVVSGKVTAEQLFAGLSRALEKSQKKRRLKRRFLFLPEGRVYQFGRARATISAGPLPLTAITMYCLPLWM